MSIRPGCDGSRFAKVNAYAGVEESLTVKEAADGGGGLDGIECEDYAAEGA